MKRRRKAVEVVVAPSSFPGGDDARSQQQHRPSFASKSNINSGTENKRKGIDIDFNETAREIYNLGSTQFVGSQLRQYKDEQYKTLTGRDKKKQKVPVKIVREIKKAAIKREKRLAKELKESGVVTATTSRSRKKQNVGTRKDINNHGPAPSIGFTKKGVYRVSVPPK